MSELCREVDVEPEKPMQEELPCEQVLEEFPTKIFGVVDRVKEENEEVVRIEDDNHRHLSYSSLSDQPPSNESQDGMMVQDLDDSLLVQDLNDSLIVLINDDGTVSLDPSQLARLWGPNSDEPEASSSSDFLDGLCLNRPGVPVRLLRVTNDYHGGRINLTVEGRVGFTDMILKPLDTNIRSQEDKKEEEDDSDEVQIISVQKPEKKKKKQEVEVINARETASTSDTGDHNAFIGMDRDQLLRLEKLLKSDEAKQILGENVTAMLDMLTSEEEVPPMTVALTPLDAIRMDHNYTNLISPSPRAASPQNIPIPTTSTNQAPSTPSQSTGIVKIRRSVGRPRKFPRPSPVLSEHLRKQRAQQIRPAHPGATLVPVITPLHIGLSKALKRASEGVGVKVVMDGGKQNIVALDSDQLISHSKKVSATEESVAGTSALPSVPLQLAGEAEPPVKDITCASGFTTNAEKLSFKRKKTYVPKKGKVVKSLKRKLVKIPGGSKKLSIPGSPKKKNIHASKLASLPNAQLLNDAMADALAAMESPSKPNNASTVAETVIQKDPTPKTYGRANRAQKSTELKVDIPEVKEQSGSPKDMVVMPSVREADVLEVAAPLPVFKKHYPKRENRKPPAHLVDAFGPALFSTPDIIRRVSLESKVEDTKSAVVQRPPSPVTEKLPPIIMQSPPLSSDGLDTQPEQMLPLTNGIPSIVQPSEESGPAVIVLMEEAILPCKSTAIALSKTQSVLGRVELEKLVGACDNTLGTEDIMDVSLCPLDSNETNVAVDESDIIVIDSDSFEQSGLSCEQSPSNLSVPQTDIPSSSKRKRRTATLSKKKRAYLTEQKTPITNSDKKSKNRKLGEKDSLQASTLNLLLESDDEGDIESDDISWNSEDDPDRLWCICKKPHNNRFMICCDSCNFWFHGKCVGITKAMGSAMELKEEDWTCPACVKKKTELITDEPKSTQSKKKQTKQSSTLLSGNTSTSGLPQTNLPDESKTTTVSDKKKRARNKNLVPVVKLLSTASQVPPVVSTKSATAGAMICVVCCKNEARLNSIYCSDSCILTHAQESGQPATSKTILPITLKEALQKVSPPKAVPPKQVASKGAPQKPVSAKVLPVKILPKKAGLKSNQAKPTLPNVVHATSDAPKRGISRLSLGKKRPSGEGKNINQVLHASLDTSHVAEGSTEVKANIKAVHDVKEMPMARHLQLIDMKELSPLQPKPGVSIKSPKTPPKILQSPTKQLPISPKVTKALLAKGSESSPKVKGPTSSPLSSPLKEKGAAKKVDSKRQVSVDTPKKEDEKTVGPEPVRINVRKTLHELLHSRIQDCEDLKSIPDEKVKKITQKIEEELFAVFKDTGMRYKSKYRSLVFNIKDPKNLTLFRKIAEKSVTPYQLVRLTPEELASQELADWRERESKHQLEMIKKNELDLMSLSKTYVMKTHKGEQVIESEGIVPAAPVSEIEDSPDPDSRDGTLDVADSGKEKSKKHRSHRDKDKTKLHKRDKSKEKSKHGKSKHREKRRDSTKTEKSEKKKRKGKEGKKSDVNVVPNVETQMEGDATVIGKEEAIPEHIDFVEMVNVASTEIGIVSPTEQTSKEPIVEPISQENVFSDPEPTSTTIQVLDINSIDPNLCLTVWKGFMSMLEVSKFFSTVQIVHGDPGDLFNNLPDTMNIVGRISPSTVWEYISKMKKSGTKDILIIRFTAANEEQQIPYFTLYSYLSGRSRLGVVGRVSKKIKDFYILPLSKHNPVPQVLLPLDGPGFEDNRPHLLLGIVVRSKLKSLSADNVYKAQIARKYTSSPTEHSSGSRSYTPPLRGVGLPEQGMTPPLHSTSLDYESTPPSSPCESTLAQRIELKIIETNLSICALSSKMDSGVLQDDGDEPYTPGGSDDDMPPVDVMGNPSNQLDLQRTMEELNRKIAEQKQQIQTISSAIRAPHPAKTSVSTEQKNLPSEDHSQITDGDEAYSPSSSFTPPRVASPSTTSKDATLPHISLPANLQEILANIKKQSDFKTDAVVHSYAAKKDDNVTTGKRELYVPSPVTTVSEATYVPSVIHTTISSTSTSSVSTSSLPKCTTESVIPSADCVVKTKNLPSIEESVESTSSKNVAQKPVKFVRVLQDTATSTDCKSSVTSSFSSKTSSKSVHSSLSTCSASAPPMSPLTSQSTVTSSPSESSGVFQTIPLMLGAISPSALFPKSEKTRDPRQDFSEQAKNRLTKYGKRGLPLRSGRELGDRSPGRSTIDVDEPPPPGVDTPPRPVPPPRGQSPPRPPPPTETDYVQSFSCPPPNYQPVGYPPPLPLVPGPMQGVGYPIQPPYYGPGYMPPLAMGNMMHPRGPGPLQMGFNPPYQDMHYAGPSGMYGGEGNQNRQQNPYGQRGNPRWKYKGKKRGRQEERGRDKSQRGDQSKDKSYRGESRDTKSRDRSGHRKKSRNKSRSRDRSK